MNRRYRDVKAQNAFCDIFCLCFLVIMSPLQARCANRILARMFHYRVNALAVFEL